MNNIAVFLAQLSAGQPAPSQNGLGNTGESGLQNFQFWSTVVDSSEQTLNQNADIIAKALQNNKKSETLLFTPDAKIDLSERIQQAEKLIDRLTVKQSELAVAVEDQAAYEQITQQIDILKQQLELFNTGIDNATSPVPVAALILSGYSPSQIKDIQKNIKDLEVKLDRPITLEDVIAGVDNVLPEAENKTDELDIGSSENGLPDFVVKIIEVVREQTEQKPITNEEQPSLGQIIQAILQPQKRSSPSLEAQDVITDETDAVGAIAVNNLPIGEDVPINPDGTEILPQTPREMTAREMMTERAAKIASQNNSGIGNTAQQKSDGVQLQNLQNPVQANAQNNVSIPQTFMSFDDAMFFSSTDTTAFNIHSGLPFTTTSQAAHMITHAQQQAGQPHPASEMVSARLQQAAQNGEQRLTLQLDPAELGRLEVELVFSKEKTLKASILIEKPETFFMMQRDSGLLERALQNSGLELDGNGIDFELAEDGSAFEQNNEGEGGGEKYGGSNDNA
ncbi:MAG: flagellar hook-length control protein FliK, partial [Pseudomonadota bacterium]